MARLDQPYLPADECLLEYEQAVHTIAKRRIIRLLFRHSMPLSISAVLESTNVSINALAATYAETQQQGYVAYDGSGLLLTEAGRRWSIRERKSIFSRKVVVHYGTPSSGNSTSLADPHENQKLPAAYRLSLIDGKKL